MDDPRRLTLTELAKAFRAGNLGPVAVTEAYLDKLEPGPVYRVVTAERARSQARQAENLFARGIDLGPLQGIPVALKDLMDTRGEVSAAGSSVLAKGKPASEDCPAAARLDAAGAVFLGKTNMTELAFSGLGLNPHFGTAGNALDETRIPGGSSSGSAVAVAKGLACAAIGSDTGGSVRIPASFNGLVGLKTTNGTIPNDGVIPLSTSLDTLGPITRTLEDAWHVWLTLSAKPSRPFASKLPECLNLLVPETMMLDELDTEVAAAFEATCERLIAQGHQLKRQAVPEFDEILGLYRDLGSFASHESLALYGDLLETQGDEIDPRVAKRILQFRGRSSVDYLSLVYAQKRLIRHVWERYRAFDAMLAPTVAILPPAIGALEHDDAAYFRANALCLRNTSIFNFLSGPAVTVPCGVSATGLSVGLMVATAPHQEAFALGIASLIDKA